MVIDPLRQGAAALVLSPQQSQDVDAIVARVNRMLGSYVRGLVAVSALAGVVTGLALWGVGLYFGTRYALVIGLLAGVTYAVPWLGQTVSAGAALLAGLATADHHSILAGLVSAGLVVAINQISDNLVMPRIVGRQVGLHPLAVLFALMAGFQLWGLVGLIVAVPIAAAIRIALHRWVPTLPEDEEEETSDWAGRSAKGCVGSLARRQTSLRQRKTRRRLARSRAPQSSREIRDI
jgi:predicted PurR-regulated permease PerM